MFYFPLNFEVSNLVDSIVFHSPSSHISNCIFRFNGICFHSFRVGIRWHSIALQDERGRINSNAIFDFTFLPHERIEYISINRIPSSERGKVNAMKSVRDFLPYFDSICFCYNCILSFLHISFFSFKFKARQSFTARMDRHRMVNESHRYNATAVDWRQKQKPRNDYSAFYGN